MLSQEKFQQLAAQHGLHSFQEEQRYYLAELLYFLKEQNMVFKGGTMTWFVYNHLRYSRDLDFNLDHESKRINKEGLKKIIKRAFGSEKYIKSYRESKTFINAEISFPGTTLPYGIKIKIEITVPYIYLDSPQTHYFNFPEYGLPIFAHRILSTESVLADKINGLQKRKKLTNVLKDAFDIWYLINIVKIKPSEKHIQHIFKKTNMTMNKELILERLKTCLAYEKQFKQYLIPKANIKINNAINEIKEYLETNL